MRKNNLLFFFLICFSALLIAQEKETPDKAMCRVCVLKGETEEEKVRAHSQYAGQDYYFCSKHCKKEFDADPEAYVPPKLPRPAPAFTVETLDGEAVSSQDFRGKIVLLDFWATWCAPCLDVMPDLQKLHDTYRDKNFSVIGISIDEHKDRIKKVRKLIDKKKISYPIYSDESNTPAWYKFNIKGIPAAFLLDETGQIIAQWNGVVNHAEVEKAVATAIAGNRENDKP